jgi:hypothetical protein
MVAGLQALLRRVQLGRVDIENGFQTEQLEVALAGIWGLH